MLTESTAVMDVYITIEECRKNINVKSLIERIELPVINRDYSDDTSD